MSCPHVAAAHLNAPRAGQPVHREECCQCFDSQDSDAGIDVCLKCFVSGCPSDSPSGKSHAAAHADRWGEDHALFVNIKRRRKPRAVREATDAAGGHAEPPMKKLAIRQELSEAEKFDWHTSAKCYACHEGGKDLTGDAGASKVRYSVFSHSRMLKSSISLMPSLQLSCRPCLPLSSLKLRLGKRRSLRVTMYTTWSSPRLSS